MSSGSPCGACKFLRRKCVSGCIFAPYFGSEQGVARFAAVHKVFGASNVSKLLLHIPTHRRHEAVVTVCYEAQAWLSDPVYGCVSTIFDLQQQVGTLQTELALVQSQLANAFHHQQQYDCNNNNDNNNNNNNNNNIGFLHRPSLYDTILSSITVTAAAATTTISNILPSSSLSTGTVSHGRALNDETSAPTFHGIPYEFELSSTLDNMSTTHPNYVQPVHDQAASMASSPDDESSDPADIQAFAHSIIRRRI